MIMNKNETIIRLFDKIKITKNKEQLLIMTRENINDKVKYEVALDKEEIINLCSELLNYLKSK